MFTDAMAGLDKLVMTMMMTMMMTYSSSSSSRVLCDLAVIFTALVSAWMATATGGDVLEGNCARCCWHHSQIEPQTPQPLATQRFTLGGCLLCKSSQQPALF
jgi:hypothetical protein